MGIVGVRKQPVPVGLPTGSSWNRQKCALVVVHGFPTFGTGFG
ncbi:MAG: hypothetical protein PHQ28_01560 [Mycobacterium sp.]|nr:hypothetical protein [Mycobacterium sp.]